MNKTELVEKVAKLTSTTKADAERAIEAVFETITEALKDDDKIAIPGFGTFSLSKRAARKGRNPQTGEEIDIKASNVAKFTSAKKLKDTLN